MKPGKWRLLESVELSADTKTRDFFLRENEDGVELVMTGSEIDQLIEQEAIWRKKVAKARNKVEKLEELRELLRRCYSEVKGAYDQSGEPVGYWEQELEELIIKELDL